MPEVGNVPPGGLPPQGANPTGGEATPVNQSAARAENLPARGGASAVEELLGLNRLPTAVGALAAPPGNSEALRHMTPTMRRTIMRGLLDKQREKMRRLALVLRGEGEGDK